MPDPHRPVPLSDLVAVDGAGVRFVTPVFPYAASEAFPILSESDLLELAQDIEENGMIHPVVLFNGQILDGRNRLTAAARHTTLALVPVEEFFGTDKEAAEHVIGLNVLRRHMSTGQKSFAALEFLPYEEDEAEKRMLAGKAPCGGSATGSGTGKARDIVAAKFGIGGRRVSEAKSLVADAPDLAAQVRSGNMALDKAVRELSARQGKSSSAATAGDKVQSEPRPQYGAVTGTDTSWRLPERDVSYAERRATAVETIIRFSTRIAEKVAQYAVTDGDLADSNEELSPEHARILADFFAGLA